MLSSTKSISQQVDTLAPPSTEGEGPCSQKSMGGEGKWLTRCKEWNTEAGPVSGSPQRLAGPHHVPHAFHPPCSGSDAPLASSTALRIRWDQTRDNTNEVAFAADSSCKERRSQSSQLEGNKMLLNSGQAGEERRGTAETGLMQLLCPQVWIYHYSARWPAATGQRDSPCRGATCPAGLPGGNQGR